MSGVLLASWDVSVFGQLATIIRELGHEIHTAHEIAELPRLFRKHRFDAVVVDLKLADAGGPGLASLVQESCDGAPTIVVADKYSRELDLRLRTQGIVHLAIKPLDAEKMAEIVLHCLESCARKGKRVPEAEEA